MAKPQLVEDYEEDEIEEVEDFKERRDANLAGDIDHNQLKSIAKRIQTLETEKAEIADDIKLVYSEAKGAGFDVKIIKQLVKIKMDDTEEETQEHLAMLAVYASVLGLDLSL